MKQNVADPEALLRTEADQVPPPDVTVPELAQDTGAWPSQHRAETEPEVLREVKDLAERVGGLEKLKEIVAILLQMRR